MDLETDIQDEIAACENTQNWTGGKAIRTRWVDELKGLDETLEALMRLFTLKRLTTMSAVRLSRKLPSRSGRLTRRLSTSSTNCVKLWHSGLLT